MTTATATAGTTTTTQPARGFETDEDRYRALLARDPAGEGRFVYAVRTTGVYCRPTCAARPALRTNLRFFADPSAAEAAGFRPCLRCRPKEPPRAERQAAAMVAACRRIEAADTPPTLAALARAAGVTPQHFAKLFKDATGVTPRAYAAAHRAGRAADGLRRGETVTAALYEAGFNAPSRFYAEAAGRLGMAPRAFRAGGHGETIRHAVAPCSLGRLLVAATPRGLCAILVGEEPDALLADLRARFPRARLEEADEAFADTLAAVVRLVEAPGTGHALPLDIRGTAFQQSVWAALRAIPAGTTATYAGIAEAIGRPTAVRAVARACASNPLAVAVPCHRVLRGDGALSGYRWGAARKRALLAREAGDA